MTRGSGCLPSLRGRLMSSNPCYSGLRRQMAEGVVRGVAYRPRQRVLLAARLECRLAVDSKPTKWRWGPLSCGVREPTSHWRLCFCLYSCQTNLDDTVATDDGSGSPDNWNSFSLHFVGHFPGEPGLAGVYWSKAWWKWWWKLEL